MLNNTWITNKSDITWFEIHLNAVYGFSCDRNYISKVSDSFILILKKLWQYIRWVRPIVIHIKSVWQSGEHCRTLACKWLSHLRMPPFYCTFSHNSIHCYQWAHLPVEWYVFSPWNLAYIYKNQWPRHKKLNVLSYYSFQYMSKRISIVTFCFTYGL